MRQPFTEIIFTRCFQQNSIMGIKINDFLRGNRNIKTKIDVTSEGLFLQVSDDRPLPKMSNSF